MPAFRRRPPRGVLALAGIFGFFTCVLVAVTVMASGMTRDPDVPLPVSAAIVAFLAAVTLLSAWTTWGILRGKRAIGQLLLFEGPKDVTSIVFDFDAIVRRLLSSEEARRWFGLPPPE